MTVPGERPEGDARPARRAPVWVIVGAAVVAVLLTGGVLVGGFLLLRDAGDSHASQPGERDVSVFFCSRTSSNAACKGQDVTESQRQEVTRRAKGMKQVRRVEYESKQEAYERFKKVFKDRKDMLQSVSPGDLPDSLRLRVTGTEGAEAVKAALTGVAGVDSVVVQPLATRT
ncbi:hypothetical protein E1293_24580 [Actinomadura darangshiensis]|uniref:FtsX extracellular domain-containing protein n=1 Tax=Actinomadura darangshiensis TaxID=705336 RepID=A0A4R5B0E9_9ACTN|nr:permease-like cell division protein FtsX [Actinomadura darangshiensis]TDD79031.1 hypothetical protein E1293_24580 [Actinomadura darangshiensis]